MIFHFSTCLPGKGFWLKASAEKNSCCFFGPWFCGQVICSCHWQLVISTGCAASKVLELNINTKHRTLSSLCCFVLCIKGHESQPCHLRAIAKHKPAIQEPSEKCFFLLPQLFRCFLSSHFRFPATHVEATGWGTPPPSVLVDRLHRYRWASEHVWRRANKKIWEATTVCKNQHFAISGCVFWLNT